MEFTCRQQLVQGPDAVTFTEDIYSCTSIRIQNLNGDNADCKQSVIWNIDSDGSISNNKLHSASGADSCLLHIAEDTITDATGSFSTLPSVEHESLFSVHRETDNRQLTVVTSEATELVDSVSSSLNSSRKLNTNAVKLRRIWYEGDENNENNYSSERYCRMVCDDDLSVFFGSPVCVFSLSAKLKTIPKRKAVSKCKLNDVSDHLHLYNHPLVCEEHELNCTVNCSEFPEELVLPLHDAVTRNFDKPAICAYVASNENYAGGQSSYIELPLPFSDTSQSHPVHVLADMNDDTSSDHCSSDCLMLPCAVSVLPPGSINLVLSSQDRIPSCLSLVSSRHGQLHLGSSVSLLCKWSDNDTLRPISESFYTQAKCCGGYSEKPLQKLLKHNSDNKPRFLYPSAAQVSPSPVSNVLEPSSNDDDLFRAERSRSLLCRTPDVLQSGLSKAGKYMNKATSLGIVTVEDPNINAELVLTSHSANLQTASSIVSYGLNRIAVNSCMDTVCKDVNKDAGLSYVSSMLECAVAETDCHKTPETLSRDVSPQSVKKSASLPSLTDSSSCSKLVHDFAGQTSPTLSHRMPLCDVGVQTSLKRLGSECTSNVRKLPLFVNAAVQTVSVPCTHIACNSFSHLCKNKHCSFNSQENNSLRRSELWHHTSYMTNESMDCKFSVPSMDILSVSSADTFENFAPFGGCAFQSAHVSGAVTAVKDDCNLSLLSSGGIKTVTMSNRLVDVEHTVGTSATVVHKNRGTGTINNAVAGHVLQVPQCVMSSESSAEFLSFNNTGELCTTECEITSADSDPDSLTMVPNNCAQVVSDISPKIMDIAFPKSFSTGFISAGGKPLNVKLSSKLNAYKLFDTVACTEGNMLKNATHTAHFSNTDATVSSICDTRKVGVCLTRMVAEPIQSNTSGLMDASSDNDSACYSNGKHRTEHKNLLELCACSMGMTNISSESNCDLSDVQFKSSASLTNICSAKKNLISACVAASAHQQPASSSEQCFTDGAADVMVIAKKQYNANACTVHADVNATYSAFNCVRMLQKSCSDDIMSNGFKPFKAPQTSMQSSKYGKNNFTEIDDCHLPDTSIAQSHSLGSVYTVNCVDETELCNLINTQRAEVVDVSLLTVNSEELFAVPCGDDINELAAEQVVTRNSTTVNMLPADNVSTSNFFTNSDIVPKYCSRVCTMQASNTEQTCEHLLTGQIHNTCDKVNTTFRIQQNSAFCSLTTSDAEDDPRDVEGCSNMPVVLMDAGFTETKPVPMVCLQSSLHGTETGADQVACCKICSCVNDHVSCRCASEKQKVSQSLEQRNTYFIDRSGNKHPFDGHSNTNDKAVKVSTDNATNKSIPFVFFSAKGSQINVSEKTVHSIRKKWINHLTGAMSAGVENRTMTEASYQGIVSQTNAGEMHVSSCRAEDVSVDELKTDGNCSRNMYDNETDETPLVSLYAISMHTADVQCTSVMANKVFMPNVKSVHTVNDDADICNDCPADSVEPSYTSCLNTSIHVNDAKAAEDRLPFRATHWCSYAEEGVDKRLTDRSVITPLCTVPESKRFAISVAIYRFCLV